MTTSDHDWRPPPWEPPLAGTEVEHLLGALDRLRTTFRWKAGHLDSAGLQTRIGASALTLGGLLKHLAFVEAYHFSIKLAGESPGPPWDTVDWDSADDDWVFTSAADETPEQLYALWDGAVERSRATLAAALDVVSKTEAGAEALKTLYSINGLQSADDTFFDDFRVLLAASGIDVASLVR